MCVHVYIINTNKNPSHTHTHTPPPLRPYKTQQHQEEISSFTHTRTRNNNNFIILMMVVSNKNNDKKFHQPTHTILVHSHATRSRLSNSKNYNERTNDTNPICLLISQNDSMCAQISLMESLKVPERQWTCSIQVQGIRSQRFISRPRTTSTYVIFVRASL